MTEADASGSQRMEFEIRGGAWEVTHALLFYVSVTCAVLATLGTMRIVLGICCVVLLFYSMFTIFSSPTYVIVDPAAHELTVEHYHYFIPRRRRLSREKLQGLEVVESPHVPAPEGDRSSKRDLSYYVRVNLIQKNGKRLKLFRSGMTGAPSDNRIKAFLIVKSIESALDIPVSYLRRGGADERAAEQLGA
ncbi:MAG: hypothetical protein C4536_12780 [Actinobacteria bacterium]|jgi:hypothetical protein|nr:MAG: hypothetical protein C4536_12780 [Actinomycetota bacterium]